MFVYNNVINSDSTSDGILEVFYLCYLNEHLVFIVSNNASQIAVNLFFDSIRVLGI